MLEEEATSSIGSSGHELGSGGTLQDASTKPSLFGLNRGSASLLMFQASSSLSDKLMHVLN